MTKRAESKYKINRHLGVNLWGRPKSPINKRDYGPGQHGQRRKSKPSDFNVQLMAKQKLKGYYGNIGEKQFRKYYEEAVRRRGDTSENLIELLERRLDAVIYRLKFAITPFASRQFVDHGHVTVNGRKVNIPSFQCKVGDEIAIREGSKSLVLLEAAKDFVSGQNRVQWLQVAADGLSGKVIALPKREDVNLPVNEQLIVELYSK